MNQIFTPEEKNKFLDYLQSEVNRIREDIRNGVEIDKRCKSHWNEKENPGC